LYLTPEGHAALKEELETLKAKKPDIIKSIKLAAADKDFRENSPLAAAKEEMGLVEGRINELEETLKIAVTSKQNGHNGFHVNIGNRVCLKEIATEEITCYTIVAAREASPLHSKISDSSPLGKALIGKAKGDNVEINVPAGKICYTIERIDSVSA
jgi:transcription elongation factor GreA